MNITILQQPDSAIARILLETDEEITTQAGTMISMSNHIEVSTTVRRGSRQKTTEKPQRLFGGESLILNTFKAKTNHCEVILAPPLLGSLLVYEITSYKLVVQTGAFLACASKVDLFLGFRGFKSSLGKDSLSWLSLTGKGPVILHSFGTVYEIVVEGECVVNVEHLIAFENSLDFKLIKLQKSWLGSFFKEESSVCRFQGQGKVYCQTHLPHRLGNLLAQKLGGKY